MIMSRKLARRRMLMWHQQQNVPAETSLIYVFREGDSDISSGYTKTSNKTTFENGVINLKPAYLVSSDRWHDSNLKISGADFSKYSKLYIECYCDWAITYADNSALVGYGSSSGFISSSEVAKSRKTIEFDLTDISESESGEYYIMANYDREDVNDDTESCLIIYNIWFEGTYNDSGDSGETEEPETPTVQTFNITFLGDNVVFTGNKTTTNETDYVARISAANGYEISSVTATINGDVVGSYVDGVLTIPKENITGDIIVEAVTTVIVVEPDPVYYSVNTNLTNTTIEPDIETIEEGSFHSAVITPADGYELGYVSVMMSGADITDSCYQNGTISIEEATGDIAITASASEREVEPTSYIIYENGSSTINYGSISEHPQNGSFISTVDGEYGYSIGTECIESYAGYATKNSSGGIGLIPQGETYAGNGGWQLTLDTSQIKTPGAMYITVSRDSYDGSTGAVYIGGTLYQSAQEWILEVINGDSTALSVSPGTGEYTYECNVDNPQEGVIVNGCVGVVGTDSVNMYVTKIEYVTNASVETDDSYNIFGNGVYGENIAWKADYASGSYIEDNNILQLFDNNDGNDGNYDDTGYPIVGFLNNKEDVGFDFTDYNTLNIETTIVVHEGVTNGCKMMYGANNSYNTRNAEDWIYLTAHSGGTVVNSMDISGASGMKYIHVTGNNQAYISRVWLGK